MKDFLALTEDKGYSQAPASTLLLNGEEPVLVYQKQTDTIAKRHHVRIWKASATFDGHEVWIGAATHDIAIAVLRHTQWIHEIDPRIDLKRSKIGNDLLLAGLPAGIVWWLVPRIPLNTTNATGGEVTTDGKMLVLFLDGKPEPSVSGE